MLLYYTCYERIVSHDVINKQRTLIMGEHIFTGAHLCNGILAVDNDVYYLAYSNIQQMNSKKFTYQRWFFLLTLIFQKVHVSRKNNLQYC